MPYAEGRVYYDADSHVMELPHWLEDYADADTRERIRPLYLGGAGPPPPPAGAEGPRGPGAPRAAPPAGGAGVKAQGGEAPGALRPAQRHPPPHPPALP